MIKTKRFLQLGVLILGTLLILLAIYGAITKKEGICDCIFIITLVILVTAIANKSRIPNRKSK